MPPGAVSDTEVGFIRSDTCQVHAGMTFSILPSSLRVRGRDGFDGHDNVGKINLLPLGPEIGGGRIGRHSAAARKIRLLSGAERLGTPSASWSWEPYGPGCFHPDRGR